MHALSRPPLKQLVSIRDLTREQILDFLTYAARFAKAPPPGLFKGLLLASCFFEPSTRTRLSFEAAMKRLGGEVIGFSEGAATSLQKEESLYDSIKVIGQYADVIVIRHPLRGAALQASHATEKPVINAGDGSNQHPTQALIDLMAILETQKKLDGLKIGFMGDLRHSRAVQSLVLACMLFDIRMYFLSPPALELPKQLCEELKRRGIIFSFHSDLDEVIDKLDLLYLTRLQKERIKESPALGEAGGRFRVRLEQLGSVKKNFKILHPLPRVKELDPAIDETEHACYFQQSALAVPLRQALLSLILGRVHEAWL